MITNTLKTMGVQMLGNLKYVRARNTQGQLTNFKTGDRFVDTIVPDEPLPKRKSMGIFTAMLYHKEQKVSKSDIECGNCKLEGHVRRECPNDPVCYECLHPGHKKGSMLCLGFKGDDVSAVSVEYEKSDDECGSGGEEEEENESQNAESENEMISENAEKDGKKR